jgi:protoheme IX farnesyltransferase
MDAPAAGSIAQTAHDSIQLMKPGIVFMTLVMAAGGMWLARPAFDPVRQFLQILAIGLGVGSANALNMFIERHSDGLMARTKGRPLPAGRITANYALAFGLVTGAVSIALSWVFGNGLTALLGGLSLLVYVLVYTPMKKKSWWALIVGAIPGAAPPLLGWTASTGEVTAGGLALFAILLLWQLPHFIAIAIYLKADYTRAGIKVLPAVVGDDVARWHIIAWSTLLAPVSLSLIPLGEAGWIYGGVALVASLAFFMLTLTGIGADSTARWARQVFLASLVYLPVLTIALVLDRVLGPALN